MTLAQRIIWGFGWSLVVLLCCPTAKAAAQDFGSVALHRSNQATVTLTITRAARLSHIAVRTMGKENADFVPADKLPRSKEACRLNVSYSVATTCTVKIKFRPRAGGARLGAAVLTDAAGVPFATSYLHGVGIDAGASAQTVASQTGVAQPELTQPESKTIIGGLNHPNGLVADERGSVYVVTSKQGTDIHGGAIFEERPLPGGGVTSIPRVTGIYEQRVIAIDGNHNLFVAGAGMCIYKQTLTSNGSYIESRIGGPMGAQGGLAVDGAGNLYVSDYNYSILYKETLLGNGSYVQSVMIAHLNAPTGLAVDGEGAVYIAVTGDKEIVKEMPVGDGYTESYIRRPFSAPQGLAFDSEGNLYVSDFAARAIYRETPTPAGYVERTILTDTDSGYLAIDAAGILYVSDPLRGGLFSVPLSSLLNQPALPINQPALSGAPKVKPRTAAPKD